MNTHRGVIGTIVLIVAALVILGIFGISFKSVWTSPIVQDNLKYAWEITINGIKAGLQAVITFVQGLVPAN